MNAPILDQCGLAYKISKNSESDIILSGVFKIKEVEEYELHAKLQSSIVMLITTPGSFYSSNPYQDIIIFDDDVGHAGGCIDGLFNINFSLAIQDMQESRFNVLFSMGKYLSNIECIIKEQ